LFEAAGAYDWRAAIEAATTFEDIAAVWGRVFGAGTQKSGQREFVDAGEKIGGAKKDTWTAILAGQRLLESADMEGMDSATASKLVKKESVISGIVEGFEGAGIDPGAGFMISKVFASYAAKPADTDIARKNYVAASDRARGYLSGVKTLDDFNQAIGQMRDEYKGFTLSPDEMAIRDDYKAKSEAWGKARLDYWEALFKDRKYFTAKGRFNSDLANKVLAEWERANMEQYMPPGTRQNYSKLSREWRDREEQNPESKRNQYRALGDRFVNILDGKSAAFSKNLDEAKKVADWAWLTPAQRVTKERVKPEKPKWTREVPEEIERSGGADRDFKPQDLIDAFKIRGVEYGNYVDEESARHHTKMLGLSFLDLSGILGVPVEQISYGGRLAIAFGARGTGNASAHYEPGKKVINMTKLHGGGSLAHEWGHFLDNVVHQVSHNGEVKHSYASDSASGKNSVNKSPVVPLGSNAPPELQQAFESLSAVMMTGTEGAKWSDIADLPKSEYAKFQMAGRIDPELKRGVSPQSVMDVLRRQTRRKWKGNKAVESPAYGEDTLSQYAAYIENMTGKKVYYTGGTSKFYADSSAMTTGDTESYWTRPHEMMARAFEMYISDKMDERGMSNSYLVSGMKGARDGAPYPRGEEKARINAEFDKLFDVLKGKKILEAALMMVESEGIFEASAGFDWRKAVETAKSYQAMEAIFVSLFGKSSGQDYAIRVVDGVQIIKIDHVSKNDKGLKVASKLPILDTPDLFDAENISVEDARQKGLDYYTTLSATPISSPAFSGAEVFFTEKGFSHIVGEHERALSDNNIKRRLKLLPKVREILQTTPFSDEARERPFDGAKEFSLLGRFRDGTVVRVVVEEIEKSGKSFLTVYDWEDVSKKMKRVSPPDSSSNPNGHGVDGAPSVQVGGKLQPISDTVKEEIRDGFQASVPSTLGGDKE
ncbi:MAG: LPD1 domain-containing protein, partial [Deltaproteobacteria bacterium]